MGRIISSAKEALGMDIPEEVTPEETQIKAPVLPVQEKEVVQDIAQPQNVEDIPEEQEEVKGQKLTLEQYSKWLSQQVYKDLGARRATLLEFESKRKQTIEFNSGVSYAIIKEGEIDTRIVPFMWQQNLETRNTWAVFRFSQFYNRPESIVPWRKFKYPILLIPMNKMSGKAGFTDPIPRGILAKFQAETLQQLQLSRIYTDTEKAQMEQAGQMISANLQLYRDLTDLEKPHYNIRFILLLLIIAAAVIIGYWFFTTHPQILSGLGNSLPQLPTIHT